MHMEDPHKFVDNLGKTALDAFEKQEFPEVNYTALAWLRGHVFSHICTAVAMRELPPYCDISGKAAAVVAESDIVLAYGKGTLRLDICYCDARGARYTRVYRRRVRQ